MTTLLPHVPAEDKAAWEEEGRELRGNFYRVAVEVRDSTLLSSKTFISSNFHSRYLIKHLTKS